MVLGFGEGRIELVLDKTVAGFGDTINGRLTLTLKKPKNARQLRVRILAEQIGRRGIMATPRSRRSEKVILYSNDTILNGEKEYPAGTKEYEFKIKVPAKSVMPAGGQMPEGKIGQAIGAISMLTGMGVRVNWFVIASLDIPGKRDVTKKVQISVS